MYNCGELVGAKGRDLNQMYDIILKKPAVFPGDKHKNKIQMSDECKDFIT